MLRVGLATNALAITSTRVVFVLHILLLSKCEVYEPSITTENTISLVALKMNKKILTEKLSVTCLLIFTSPNDHECSACRAVSDVTADSRTRV